MPGAIVGGGFVSAEVQRRLNVGLPAFPPAPAPPPAPPPPLPRASFPPLAPARPTRPGPPVVVRTPSGEVIPPPVGPNIPQSARVRLGSGERVTRGPLWQPGALALGVGGAVAANQATADSGNQGTLSPPWAPPPQRGANVEVDARLRREQQQREAEAAAVEMIRRQQRFSNNALLHVIDLVFGSAGDKATTFGRGGGFAARKILGALLDPFPEGGALGAGEEDRIARENAALRDMRERLVNTAFGALLFLPPRTGGGPVALVFPQEQADP